MSDVDTFSIKGKARCSERGNKGKLPEWYKSFDMSQGTPFSSKCSTVVEGVQGFPDDLDITAIQSDQTQNHDDRTMIPGIETHADEITLNDVMKGILQMDKRVTKGMTSAEERMNAQLESIRKDTDAKIAQLFGKKQEKTESVRDTGAIPKVPRSRQTSADEDKRSHEQSKLDNSPVRQPPSPTQFEDHSRNSETTSTSDTRILTLASRNSFDQLEETFKRLLMDPKKIYDLPLFDGKAEEWPMFFNSFRHSTGAYGYNDFENMTRLQKALKGKAYEMVEALLMHPDNVSEIMDRLRFHFGDPQRLVKSQVNKMRSMPVIADTDLGRLVEYSATVGNLVAFMKCVKGDRHLDNPMLLEEIICKLPLRYQCDWAQYVTIQRIEPDMIDFNNWLYGVAASVKMVENMRPSGSTLSNRVDKKFVGKLNETERIVCEFCQGDHRVNSCEDFKEILLADRWTWVKKNRVCFSCLLRGHQAAYCRRSNICNIDGCRRRHHRLLHETREEKSPEKSPVLSLTKGTSEVLFKIVPVTIYGHNGHEVRTFAQLDEGSSLTLIDKKLANELQLEGDEETMTMQWVNHLTSRQKTSIVSFAIRGEYEGAKKIHVTNVRTIEKLALPSQSMSSDRLIEKYPQLENIEISEYENAQPRILIGLDNTRLMKPLQCVNCDAEDVCAMKTQLGWVVYGNMSNEAVPMTQNQHVGLLSDFEACYSPEEMQSVENRCVKIRFHETRPRQRIVPLKIVNAASSRLPIHIPGTPKRFLGRSVKIINGILKHPYDNLVVLSKDVSETPSRIHGGKDVGQPKSKTSMMYNPKARRQRLSKSYFPTKRRASFFFYVDIIK